MFVNTRTQLAFLLFDALKHFRNYKNIFVSLQQQQLIAQKLTHQNHKISMNHGYQGGSQKFKIIKFLDHKKFGAI